MIAPQVAIEPELARGREDYPLLLTPGPITTSLTTRQAMLRDRGARDVRFIEMTARVRQRLLEVVSATEEHTCVPLQGSGTFAIEATLGALIPEEGKVLILVNGAYGRRMARICDYHDRAYEMIEFPERTPCDPQAVEDFLEKNPSVSHVAVVHCETTSGILNPIGEIADVVAQFDRSLIIDAMSSFGALEVDARSLSFDALVGSPNKCLEGVPGVAFSIVRRSTLEQCRGNAPSLSLDLYDQWRHLEDTGQWRFTPPTHVLAALDQALVLLEEEGGVAARRARYSRNAEIVMTGLRDLGFVRAVADEVQAPIILTFHSPADPRFDFVDFYDRLSEQGFLIYPGKLTDVDTFRIGCIGRLGETEMYRAVEAVRFAVADMGVTDLAPAAP